ncbi:probable isoprenylcysteine alpha-carbonyl methylesterase ICMEL1 [Humulus lupulus]|uniref:probable isoprenylcysteine alpha-carbonyl methylesterase ICMEL1 n=1 Tax=Humulus lupulus TaxID=3486 RepID=UPI002B417761|nr:probable isoprenylcysteine alpha-carbonyl methylesterase ICMEL1 [Humulus lupulus]
MSSQQIFPITQHTQLSSYAFPESNPSSVSPSGSSSVDTRLLKVEDDPTVRLLISSLFENEKASFQPIKPLLPKIKTTKTFYQHRRCRTNSEDSISSISDIEGCRSLRSDVGHAVAETFLLTRLSLKLLRYLGVGYIWMTRFLALGCYALLLVPGFCQVGYNYFFSSQIRKSIVYGDKPRNRLDLNLPKNSDGPKPVIAFVTGGAWIIGYKAWGSLMGQQLSERDIIVACIDYTNFPQGTISDIIKGYYL